MKKLLVALIAVLALSACGDDGVDANRVRTESSSTLIEYMDDNQWIDVRYVEVTTPRGVHLECRQVATTTRDGGGFSESCFEIDSEDDGS